METSISGKCFKAFKIQEGSIKQARLAGKNQNLKGLVGELSLELKNEGLS